MPATTATASYAPSRCNYICVCRIEASGLFTLGPADWTVDHTGPGTYVIQHNLGHDRYAVIPIVHGTYQAACVMLNVDADSVTILTTEIDVATDVALTVTIFAGQ